MTTPTAPPGPCQRGATAVEYGLLVALLAAVIVFAVVSFGGGVDGLFRNTNASFDSAISP
ncbi:Flp family type IVb pilin [Nocardioides kongjuensis]|uniref:Pilus assembly protein Flp/PilA n=1 Tax=Nocardioides kongjuensis TaxID=349522 RepID=A0A852RGL0_9ACTN|nr:pilus assembly protein Flp/PilA [Nocardioides kongjuensis]